MNAAVENSWLDAEHKQERVEVNTHNALGRCWFNSYTEGNKVMCAGKFIYRDDNDCIFLF